MRAEPEADLPALSRTAAPIDPLGPHGPGGWYVDDLVHVRAVGPVHPWRRDTVRTEHFDVHHLPDRVQVDHWVPPMQIDDDVAGLLAAELFTPGWLRGPELFERIFTGVVLSSAPDPLESWLLFYRNTLVRIAAEIAGRSERQAAPRSPPSAQALEEALPPLGGHGTITDYAPVYAHAEGLLAHGSVLELGSCFGFLSLRLAGSGRRTTASDVSPGTMRLLGTIAPMLGVRLRTRVADASRYPDPDRSADNVLAIHLLEHLDHLAGDQALGEAVRLLAATGRGRRTPGGRGGRDLGARAHRLDGDLRALGRAERSPLRGARAPRRWLVIDTRGDPVPSGRGTSYGVVARAAGSYDAPRGVIRGGRPGSRVV